MRIFLNVCWFLLVGVLFFLIYALMGALFCLTLVFIPAGIKSFKGAWFSLHPFGRTVSIDPSDRVARNVIWSAIIGIETAIIALIIGVLLCITVIGIPFGLQCFKIMKYSYAPFGATIEKAD